MLSKPPTTDRLRPITGTLGTPAQTSAPSENSQRFAFLGYLPRHVPVWICVFLLALAALFPRIIALNDFYTTDEAYFWQERVDHFYAALIMSDWPATNQTGHPGVTTMWLGSIGKLFAERAGLPAPGPGMGADFLGYLRAPLAIVNTLAVVIGYLLLRRLLRPTTALLAGLLWATAPFLIAHSRLLHLDALVTSFMTLSLLFLLVATRPADPSKPWRAWLGRSAAFIASGATAGLALLTKAPALVMLPVIGLILFSSLVRWPAPYWREFAQWLKTRETWQHLGHSLLRAGGLFMLWLLIGAAVFYLLWPAMWVNPGAALGSVIGEVTGNATQPHSSGNFFRGEAVADPGPQFYLSVLRWRGEPTLIIGMAALAILGLLYLTSRRSAARGERRPVLNSDLADEPRTIWLLFVFVSLFILAISLMSKKFDRYLLPAWPALQIIAAIGLMWLIEWWRGWMAFNRRLIRRISLVIMVGWLGITVSRPLFAPASYYLAYYNPLLGGGAAAQNVLLVGWGEGMEQIGGWLSKRPDIHRGPVLSWLPPTLTPFMPDDVAVHDLDVDTLYNAANYAVVYTSVAERDSRAVAEAYALQTPPLFTLQVNNITYATVHQLPRPFTVAVDAIFEGVHLRGYSYTLEDTTLLLTPSWDIQRNRSGGVFSFVHVSDMQGNQIAQIDTPIDDGMFEQWQSGQQFGTTLPIVLPENLPSGEYRVTIGLYNAADGQRLILENGQALPEEIDGPHTIQLFTLQVGDNGYQLNRPF